MDGGPAYPVRAAVDDRAGRGVPADVEADALWMALPRVRATQLPAGEPGSVPAERGPGLGGPAGDGLCGVNGG